MRKFVLVLLLSLGLVAASREAALAIQCGDALPGKDDPKYLELLGEYQTSCQQKIQGLRGEQKTLAATISYLNTQISLTQSQIAKTQVELDVLEADIATLSGKINTLNISLDRLTTLLLGRISTIYKRSNLNPAILFFSSEGFSDFLSRLNYLKLVQKHDQEIIRATEQARANYDAQKALKEAKQAEVEAKQNQLLAQKNTLAQQQKAKQQLLTQTKNDEKTYQTLLSKATAELAAIQGIIAGKGKETLAGEVSEGAKIASYIPSSSACSTGAHLHFEVVKSQIHQNPFSFLSSKSLSWDNLDAPQNGSGSWNWPINDPIRITQGYGNTFYSYTYANNVHTGVDMVSSGSYEVKAVRRGTLYRGGIGCGGGTLQYVRVDHAEDEYDTYYLHVNYI